MKFKKIIYNAPVTLSFALISLGVLFLNYLTAGNANNMLFSVYRSSLLDPFTYIRMFTHVLGHANFDHYINNMMLFLILGPLLEDKYGSKNLLLIIASVALVTGLVHTLLFPRYALLGASGVVFAFILLSSITNAEDGIPLTLILVAILYIGSQIYEGVFLADNVSQLTHIVGGITGAVIGLTSNKGKKSWM
ncbi:MAG: rhomboid family intramembrane serine protease [Erysipelotrichaceae bacterium]|nr:rhomboid family intramembrane serine protease [Erysipelotrichaceae bacterium]